MTTSLAFIFLAGLLMAAICKRIGLPRIIGMLITGIVLGPYVLNLLDPSILSVSSDLRQIALIIILLKAGLSLNLSDLKKVGRPAIMMSFVPASFEILAYLLFAPGILGINRIEAALMGATIGAVSPAVVVPRMVQLMDEGYGTDKSIPQLILAGASAVLMIFIALIIRSVGVAICLAGTSMTLKERVFCTISFLPKATVQAAIGSVPLAMGLPCGQIVLSVAVLSILIAAPLGAIGMDLSYKHLLEKNHPCC